MGIKKGALFLEHEPILIPSRDDDIEVAVSVDIAPIEPHAVEADVKTREAIIEGQDATVVSEQRVRIFGAEVMHRIELMPAVLVDVDPSAVEHVAILNCGGEGSVPWNKGPVARASVQLTGFPRWPVLGEEGPEISDEQVENAIAVDVMKARGDGPRVGLTRDSGGLGDVDEAVTVVSPQEIRTSIAGQEQVEVAIAIDICRRDAHASVWRGGQHGGIGGCEAFGGSPEQRRRVGTREHEVKMAIAVQVDHREAATFEQLGGGGIKRDRCEGIGVHLAEGKGGGAFTRHHPAWCPGGVHTVIELTGLGGWSRKVCRRASPQHGQQHG